jgi:DMSO/TMAO reductase YedYZ heme-binding membrane subunit
MNLPWYVARAAGLVSWALLTLSITWGFLLSSRVLGRRPGGRWLKDLHRFFGGLAVVFVAVHVVAILFDSYVHFSLVQVLVPFTSDYRPLPLAWGIVGFYLLVAVELTSLAMHRLPRKLWHGIHLLSYPLFVMATIHLLTAGTDATNTAVLVLAIAALAETTVFLVARLIQHRRRTPTRLPPADRPVAAPERWAPEPVGTASFDPGPVPTWATAELPAAPPVAPPRAAGRVHVS